MSSQFTTMLKTLRSSCLLFALVLLLSSCAIAEQQQSDAYDFGQVRFPPVPRVAITREQLAARKAADDFEKVKASAVSRAENILKKGVTVPDGEGDWIFYYANPENGQTLKPLSLERHQCPKTGKIFTDKRIVAAYRTKLHNQANSNCQTLGWAYAYTGDDRFVTPVRDALLKLANDYSSYPKRRDRWGRSGWFAPLGGRRYSQSLSEAVGVIDLCRAYDLTRLSPVYSDEDHQAIAEKFFRPTAKSLLWFHQGINNHQTWYNAGLLAIASVLEDKQLVERVMNMPGGVAFQLKGSIDADGLWYEGTMAYHFYALSAMRDVADIANNLGLAVHQHPSFKLMFDAPLKAAYPNGIFPAINDSDLRSITAYRSHYQWAYERYGDDRYLDVLANLSNDSINMPATGLAILRRGTGDNAACIMLDYGPHGGGHGHRDKLQLLLFASDREWLLDPGRLNYRHKEYKTWVKTTAAHNTVAINQQDQTPHEGELLWFKDEESFAACAIETRKAYSGSVLQRCVLLTDEFAVDVFDVKLQSKSDIDWLMHVTGDLQNEITPAPKPTPLGNRDGYQHLTLSGEVKAADGPLVFEGKKHRVGKPGQLRVFIQPIPNETLLLTAGIGHQIDDQVPCLIRRVTAKSARFIAIYDISGQVRNTTVDAAGNIVVDMGKTKHHVSLSAKGVTHRAANSD